MKKGQIVYWVKDWLWVIGSCVLAESVNGLMIVPVKIFEIEPTTSQVSVILPHGWPVVCIKKYDGRIVDVTRSELFYTINEATAAIAERS